MKMKTLSMFNKFAPAICAVYELKWKNKLELDRPETTIYYGACALHAGINKATDTLSEHAIIIALPQQ
jgi:hypothetical protein